MSSEAIAKSLSPYEKGWIEGVIDSEGCLTLDRQERGNRYGNIRYTYMPELRIVNTDLRLIERAKRLIGGSIKVRPARSHAKPAYTLTLCSRRLRIVLPSINLLIKESQRAILLEVLRLLSFHRAGYTPSDLQLGVLYMEMKRLNKKGL